MEVAATITQLLQDALGTRNIDPATHLVDYGLDSVRATELVIAIEDAFRITIRDENVAGLTTLAEVIDHVESTLAQRDP